MQINNGYLILFFTVAFVLLVVVAVVLVSLLLLHASSVACLPLNTSSACACGTETGSLF